MSNPLRLGVAGLGTVGTGVVKIVQRHGDLLASRCGRPVEITAVSARSRSKDRGVDLSTYAWEDDPMALAARDDVDVFVELMGGENGPALDAATKALQDGRHVVSANKAMLARHGQKLALAAEKSGVSLRFEAAVAGGIPVVKALTEGLAGNQITRVMGVMNGTCNYILTEMERTGRAYGDVLTEAQQLGYAEADPTFDVGGFDAAQKLALLAATAFGSQVDYDGLDIEGIDRVNLADIEHASELGYRIKLLGVANNSSDGVDARMKPCLVPENSAIGKLEGVTNMIVIEGDSIGQVVLSGPGAGEGPTASAVLGDITDIARGLNIPAFGVPADRLKPAKRAAASPKAAYYLRFLLTDAPGALARVATVLGEGGISIDRMRQVQHAGPQAPVLIVTHDTVRSTLDKVLQVIADLDVCLAPPVAIRIEDV
ncbi:homoserine dehydrogenase [Amaricoccus tamworthensis]|uniref:homoserine dehydrogenase n=1 Tax=Amaricoccus tamworthensis TaxID=57002 RepID=UPI003C7AFB47